MITRAFKSGRGKQESQREKRPEKNGQIHITDSKEEGHEPINVNCF